MMGVLHHQLTRYLDFRRQRGFALDVAARMLESFVLFVEHRGETAITIELFARWNTRHPASHMTMERRSIAVRGFVKWLRIFDLRHEVPPPYRGLLGKNRPKPHIYTDEEIAALLKGAAKLATPRRIRAVTYPVLWGLLYVTGVRIGEALAIDVAHIDFEAGTILIPARKGSYDRLVPLHATTVEALKAFLRQRNRLLGARPDCLFTDENGERLRYPAVGVTFVSISKAIKLRPPGLKMGDGPTIHDLRHTFAVNTLKRWYREGTPRRCSCWTAGSILR